jgi:hypothetical protein
LQFSQDERWHYVRLFADVIPAVLITVIQATHAMSCIELLQLVHLPHGVVVGRWRHGRLARWRFGVKAAIESLAVKIRPVEQ